MYSYSILINPNNHEGNYTEINDMVVNVKHVLTHSCQPKTDLYEYCFNVVFPSPLDVDTADSIRRVINGILFIHELMLYIDNRRDVNGIDEFLTNEYNKFDEYLTELINKLWRLQ